MKLVRLAVFVASITITGVTVSALADPATPTPLVRADNTAVNQQDRSHDTPTPMDQANDAASLKITADIRKAIVGDNSLSTSAHNVKIITAANAVVLRGPVATAAEKERIAGYARRNAAGATVRDELTIAP